MSALRAVLLAGVAFVWALSGCGDARPTEAGKTQTPTLTAVSAVTQQATVNQTVTANPTVRVTDEKGQPLPGSDIVFATEGLELPPVLTGPTGRPPSHGNSRRSPAPRR